MFLFTIVRAPLKNPYYGKRRPTQVMEIKTFDTAGTKKAGFQFGKHLVPGDIVTLSGVLGVGKTVFAQGIAEALGVIEPVTSPSFILINEYSGTMKLYHMDLYRLNSVEEFFWLGIEEMLNGSGVCLIEWGDHVINELPDRTIQVNIEMMKDGERSISVTNASGKF